MEPISANIVTKDFFQSQKSTKRPTDGGKYNPWMNVTSVHEECSLFFTVNKNMIFPGSFLITP